ncbi:hypothetical protein NHP200010_05670 [Helicobacter bizzozeronii]|uniref:tetratricopeptide repeat protein n=1 Tax=Helicobacter bizzozeronii TaxID=56877 RepID=UPI00244D7D81|nr:tetratricopeptide repeat protein [Helicobacter bizzozeronii]GMB92856.1 hypothetical protein NHP200010_05670 [Helicobacter bizzozeronii]
MVLGLRHWACVAFCGVLLASTPVWAQDNLVDQGKQAEKQHEYHKAFVLYQKASDQGNPLGTAYLGHLYKKGKGVAKDYHKAKQYFEKAIEMSKAKGEEGSAPAIIFAKLHLAKMYQEGKGVPQDYQHAFQIYQNLALDLARQQGTLDLQALKTKHYNAYGRKMLGIVLYHLGEAYKKGYGVHEDSQKALALLNKAVTFGSRHAEKELH